MFHSLTLNYNMSSPGGSKLERLPSTTDKFQVNAITQSSQPIHEKWPVLSSHVLVQFTFGVCTVHWARIDRSTSKYCVGNWKKPPVSRHGVPLRWGPGRILRAHVIERSDGLMVTVPWGQIRSQVEELVYALASNQLHRWAGLNATSLAITILRSA